MLDAGEGLSKEASLSRVRPEWLKVKIPAPEVVNEVAALIREKSLVTVCEEARCPNLNECWGIHKTATFMLMGDVCTRHCGFCSVGKGAPGSLDPGEPQRVAEAVALLQLKFAVITSVNRDDLPWGGAEHFSKTVEWIKSLTPDCGIELLIPDFKGNSDALNHVLASRPQVLNHNVETIPRLYKRVRPDAGYDQSMKLLRTAATFRDTHAPMMRTKSGIMVGLGESSGEVLDLMKDWRDAQVNIITLGQYLPPTHHHLPLDRYVTPEEFQMYQRKGLELGFDRVESGPLVRSSYHARESFVESKA